VNVNGPFNPKNLFGGELPEETATLSEQIATIREQLKKTRTELSNTRHRMERREREFERHMRVGAVVLVATILSCVALATVLWYRVPLLRHTDEPTGNLTPAAQLPASSRDHPQSIGQNPQLPERSKSPQPVQGPAEANVARESLSVPSVASVDKSKTVTATSRDDDPDPGKGLSASEPLRLLSDNVNRDRIDFEITRNKTDEVAPGIYLTIHNTNVEQQRIDALLQIAEDGRTLRLREQKAQTVVIFTTKRDARSRELVFTRIDKSKVAGYLLIPT